MLRFCSLSVLESCMSHCSCLFLCMILTDMERRIGLGHMERKENNRIAKKVYVGECAGSRSMGG